MGTGCLFNASPVAASPGIRPRALPSKTEAQRPPQTLSEAKSTKIPTFRRSVFTSYVPQLSFFVQKEMSASKSPFRPDLLLVLEIQPHRWPSHLWFTDWFTRCDTSQTFFSRACRVTSRASVAATASPAGLNVLRVIGIFLQFRCGSETLTRDLCKQQRLGIPV